MTEFIVTIDLKMLYAYINDTIKNRWHKYVDLIFFLSTKFLIRIEFRSIFIHTSLQVNPGFLFPLT